jgi:hypothetical protein
MSRMGRIALVLTLLSLSGCLDFPRNNTTFVNGQTQGGGSPTGASPVVAPTPGVCAVARLAGGIFGDVGTPACDERVANFIPVGCTAFGTVTPKLVDGTDASPAIHGQALDLRITEGQTFVTFAQDDDNLFNYTVKRISPGVVTIRASLTPLGCPQIEREYTLP